MTSYALREHKSCSIPARPKTENLVVVVVFTMTTAAFLSFTIFFSGAEVENPHFPRDRFLACTGWALIRFGPLDAPRA